MQARNSPRALRDGLKAVPCILLISVLVSAQTPTAANWSQFRGDARLTGIAAAALPDRLTLRWTYEAGESIESSAAIVDGAVYVGSAKGELLAIDLESGKLRWKYSTGEGGFIGESSPAVGADAVYVAISPASFTPSAFATDAGCGRSGPTAKCDRRRCWSTTCC